MITEEFKEKLTSAMNKGGWGKENIKEVLPLIEDLEKQLLLHGVGNCKREDTLKHFKEMNELFLEAIIEVENGIYDPIEEFGKELADKYIIIKK